MVLIVLVIESVWKDVQYQFGMIGCKFFMQSFNWFNFYYEVFFKFLIYVDLFGSLIVIRYKN